VTATNANIAPLRQEILCQLERLSELTPEVRFGQLIANLAFLAAGPWDQTLWDLEDDQLLAAIGKYLADLSEKRQSVA
jgi:hypothetical protein